MTIFHPFAAPLRDVTVRELERHGLDRLGDVAALVFPGDVHMCGDCAGDHDVVAAFLANHPEVERADIRYGTPGPLTAIACHVVARHRRPL